MMMLLKLGIFAFSVCLYLLTIGRLYKTWSSNVKLSNMTFDAWTYLLDS